MECGGLRVSELNPPHSAWSGGVCRPSVKNQGKNLPEQESCIPTGRANAAALDQQRMTSPPFLPLFLNRFSEGIFFIFAHFWPPLGTPKITKNRQKSTSEAFLFPSLCLSCFFSFFWLILDDFEDAKCVYFIGRADKICILAKNEL